MVKSQCEEFEYLWSNNSGPATLKTSLADDTIIL